MTFRVGDAVFISEEVASKCELCGVVEETRPYGPNGKRICYDCGQKDWKATEVRMHMAMFGSPPPVKH